VIVTHVSLRDYRNYAEAELSLSPGPTLFVGSNGQGKTNLVEAIGYLSSLRSHRVSSDAALIRQGADFAVIRARIEHAGRQISAEVQLNRSGANRAQLNRSPVKMRELPRYFSSVLFAPEDLALVRGEPAGRRRYLDELLALLSPRLLGVIADYDRVLRQRNTLLKSARASRVRGTGLSTLEVWDERLVEIGSDLIAARSELVAELLPRVQGAYRLIAGEDHAVGLTEYRSILSRHPDDDDSLDGIPSDQAMISAAEARAVFQRTLDAVRGKELERGVSLVGPHRDDLVMALNGLPARGYASHGESWSLALALKLAAAETLRNGSGGGDPVLILDDVFAELDERRRGRLSTAMDGFEQVLVTAAVPGDVPEGLRQHMVAIEAGRILD